MVQRLKSLSLYIFLGLLAYMPLHIFLSTWLGTSFNVLELAKVAKDVVLVGGFLVALGVSWRQSWFKPLLKDRLVVLMLAYTAWTLFRAAVRNTDIDAELLALTLNLRFLIFFGYGVLLVHLFDPKLVIRRALITVGAVAVPVLAFGVIQYTALSSTALTHVGYTRANGVLPAFFIDDKPDLERVMSTIRDPNSLGSYILIITSLALAFWLRKKGSRLASTGMLMLGGLCLVFTFSRSAWIGFVVAGLTFLAIRYGRQFWSPAHRKLQLAVLGALVVGGLALIPLRDTYLVKNVVFHADESTVLADPNQLRAQLWDQAITTIGQRRLGFGPGRAGLASVRNQTEGPLIVENYYLQIALEVGIIGLGLFLAILATAAWRLFKLADDSVLALGLLASFAALAVTNFLAHIWSNEAVAYTWWGLAGLILVVSQRAGAVVRTKK